mgnify:FL=1
MTAREAPRSTWVSDEMRTHCVVCYQPFTFIRRRRHHCRCCGDVICGGCSNFFSDAFVRATAPGGEAAAPVRVCRRCFYNRLGVLVVYSQGTFGGIGSQVHGSAAAAQKHFDSLGARPRIMIKLCDGVVIGEDYANDDATRATSWQSRLNHEATRLRRNFVDERVVAQSSLSQPTVVLQSAAILAPGPSAAQQSTASPSRAVEVTPSRSLATFGGCVHIVRDMVAVVTRGGVHDAQYSVRWCHNPCGADEHLLQQATAEPTSPSRLPAGSAMASPAAADSDLRRLLDGRSGAVISPRGDVLCSERPVWRSLLEKFSDAGAEPLAEFRRHGALTVEHRDGECVANAHDNTTAAMVHFIRCSFAPIIVLSPPGELIAVKNVTSTSFLKSMWRFGGAHCLERFFGVRDVLCIDCGPLAVRAGGSAAPPAPPSFPPVVVKNMMTARERTIGVATAALVVLLPPGSSPPPGIPRPPSSQSAGSASPPTSPTVPAASAAAASSSQPSPGRLAIIERDPRYVPSTLPAALQSAARHAFAVAAANAVDEGALKGPSAAIAPPALPPSVDCPICFEAFRDTEDGKPVLCLSCGQSYCRRCRSQVIRCPMCRKPIDAALPVVTNVALLQLLTAD